MNDLEVRRNDGEPLLWRCAEVGVVTDAIASDDRLAGQYGEIWNGRLPLEKGDYFHLRFFSFCFFCAKLCSLL